MIMKNQLLNLKMIALVCLMMVLGGANVWAEQYKIVFKTNTSDGNITIDNNTKVSDVVSEGVGYISSFNSCSIAFYNCKSGVKLGNKSTKGTLNFIIASPYQDNIKKITIKSVKYGSDTGTLTLYNGTTSLKSGITPGTDYTHTFDAPTTVSSIMLSTSAKRAYISEIILETAESNTPTLVASETALDFGSVENNTSKDLAFKLSGTKLTADATLSVDGEYFTVAPTTVAQTDGTIAETDVTVSYKPTAVGSHTATLTISSTGAEAKTITLTGKSANAYNVSWNVNGNVYTDGTPTTKVFEDEKVSVLPTAPADINGKVFVGWTNASLSVAQDAAPSVLFTDAADAPTVTGDVTYYAVFANRAGSEVTYTKLASNKFKTDATYVIGAEGKETGSIDYFYKYENVNTDCWGKMTSDLSVNSPIVFALSGTADKLMAKDNNRNYLKCVNKNFQMSSTEASIKLNTDGTLLDVTGSSNWLRYNTDGDYGLRWYETNKTTGNLAYFYEVSGGYTYSGYCTTVGATYTPATVNFVAYAGAYYATFSNAKVVFMPKNVTISAVTVDNNNVVMWKSTEGVLGTEETVNIEGTDVAGYYIPANTGVLLNSKNSGEVTYYTVKNKEVAAYSADLDNMLMPSVAGGEFTADPGKVYYKLAYNDYTAKTGLGFYWGAIDGGAFYVKAGTAYLAVPKVKAAGAKGFAFNGEATGIEGVNANVENAKAIYNLNGQRVASMAKPGLYIVNGKKVVRK